MKFTTAQKEFIIRNVTQAVKIANRDNGLCFDQIINDVEEVDGIRFTTIQGNSFIKIMISSENEDMFHDWTIPFVNASEFDDGLGISPEDAMISKIISEIFGN